MNNTYSANQIRELQRQEEEVMTKYTPEDLNSWEFKILRANKLGGFASRYELQKALEQEAQTGWQLVEKFDDFRIRLKRKLSDRSKDANAEFDPYRTIYGFSNVAVFFIFIIIALSLMIMIPIIGTFLST